MSDLFSKLKDAETELRAIDMHELADAVNEANTKCHSGIAIVPEAIPDIPCTGVLVHDEFTACPRHDHAR